MSLARLDSVTWSRRGRVAADVACMVLVLCMAAAVWPRSAPPTDLDLGVVPWWGGTRDLLLEGPDAGEWARNIRLLAAWDLEALDHHRLPTWMLMVAAVHKLEPSVVLAGHLVNRGLYLVMALAAFGLGRLSGSRAAGVLAAAVCLGLPAATTASQRFGIDIAIMGSLPAMMLLSAVALRRWPVGLLAGLVAGLATGLHYTTLPYALPPLVMLLLGGQGLSRRLGGALLFVLGAGASLWFLSHIYPIPTLDQLAGDIANGIDPGYRGNGRIADVAEARQTLEQGLVAGVPEAVQTAIAGARPEGLPWGLLVVLPWLGIVGPGLRWRDGDGPPWKDWLRGTDAALGIGLLLCLAPLPLLAAVDAPERYGNNFLPIVAVLVARGLATIAGSVDLGIRQAWGRWPRGVLLAVLTVPLVLLTLRPAMHTRVQPAPRPDELGIALLGQSLSEHLPAGVGVASPIREALVVAGMEYCPLRICPVIDSESAFEQCVQVMAQECSGDGPIPYVRTTAAHYYDPNATARPAMDAWVAEKWPATDEVSYRDFSAWLHLIDRPDVPDGFDPLKRGPLPDNNSGL
ncbi:MAG: hypothetical protein H6742_13715 [Alphaproteobacteria bacterium]|nr:hypothetical protein [Alphaproteobacteria bacterium]